MLYVFHRKKQSTYPLGGVISAVSLMMIAIFYSSISNGEECVAGNVKQAIIANQTLLEKNPNTRDARLDLAKCYLIKNDLVSAEKHISILLHDNANDVDVLLIKALVFYRKQEWQSAEDVYLRVLELEPDNAESYMVLGNIYAALGAAEKAKWYMDQYKTLTGNNN